MNFYLQMARMVPADTRKHIVDEKFIDIALNSEVTDTPMEYLFDVYEEFVDIAGEFDNWYCYKCRESILHNWKQMLPHLIELNK